jgi:hypothetical protein
MAPKTFRTGTASIAARLCGHLPITVEVSARRSEIIDNRLMHARAYTGWKAVSDPVRDLSHLLSLLLSPTLILS